ncbi:MAG: response regulator [Gammaproteobacteria bacterium]
MSEEVLLLDDDATMLSILEGILSAAGYNCLVKTDAEAALSLIAQRPQIGVVLSDILMPGVTGLQFVDRLNGLALEHTKPRVLLLTAQPTVEAAVDALRLGVNDFLVKPIRPPELLQTVARAVAQARADRTAHQARPPQVEQLMRQAEELAGRLRSLAYSTEISAYEAGERAAAPSTANRPARTGAESRNAPAGTAPAREPPGDGGRLAVLDTIEHLRRLRARYEHHKLDDVAWDLLLELLRAERLRQRLSVSGLAISISGVSATTSLRRMNELASRGYIERIPDPADARRDFVTLTPKSQELLAEYLAQANAYVYALTG